MAVWSVAPLCDSLFYIALFSSFLFCFMNLLFIFSGKKPDVIYNGCYSVGTIVTVDLGENKVDEVLDMLDKTAKRVQKTVDETKEATWKQSALYEQIMQSPQASDEQKIKAFIKKTRYLDQLEALNSQLSLLYTLQIFAFKVKVLEITVDNINEQLVKSGVLLKTGELEEVKKNIDALKILIEAQYESMKEIRETQNKTLDYIH
jgi:gas vesicle protein